MASHNYVRVVLNAVAVTIVLALVALLFAAGDRRLAPAPGRTTASVR